jgi:transposase
MSEKSKNRHPAQKRYPPELRERAVRMVQEARRAAIDGGLRPGISSEDKARLADLERENRELRRANEILKASASFFARELDPRLPK